MRGCARYLVCCLLLLSTLWPAQPVRARHAMVVSREGHATDAGVAVLRAGGNAVDAAVAVGFALAVTHPQAGNIGGGGFMLIRFSDGRTTFLDFRERAPLAAAADMYLDATGKPTESSQFGYRASGVPGSVSGFELAHRRYGSLKWPRLLAPAIRLAREGFPVSYDLARSLRSSTALARDAESRRVFQRDGRFYEAGEVMRQPELAAALARIASVGSRDFYTGETARLLVKAQREHGGLITRDDLAGYQAVERTPLVGTYKSYRLITAPPPSSGGVGLLEMLGVLDGSGYEREGAGSAASIHFVAETMRRFYADRARYLGDPDFTHVPVAGLISERYTAGLRRLIDPERATPSDQVAAGRPEGNESDQTTHYSIVDANGNAVAVTYTLNGSYGSGVTVPGAGFLLNNEMDDFTVAPGVPNMFGLVQGEVNRIAPRKRPLSSMTPTIVLREGKFYSVLGSPGGSRIITTVLQVFLDMADFSMGLQDAVNWPRFHHQWKPDVLRMETGFSPDTIKLLRARGHEVETVGSIGEVSAIAREGEWLAGAADPRTAGKASGY
ncbi:MAG: gamma-glutamyltransferase [Bryobacteraceae bacterium]